jgi:hypothetical protein
MADISSLPVALGNKHVEPFPEFSMLHKRFETGRFEESEAGGPGFSSRRVGLFVIRADER